MSSILRTVSGPRVPANTGGSDFGANCVWASQTFRISRHLLRETLAIETHHYYYYQRQQEKIRIYLLNLLSFQTRAQTGRSITFFSPLSTLPLYKSIHMREYRWNIEIPGLGRRFIDSLCGNIESQLPCFPSSNRFSNRFHTVLGIASKDLLQRYVGATSLDYFVGNLGVYACKSMRMFSWLEGGKDSSSKFSPFPRLVAGTFLSSPQSLSALE